MFIQFDTQRKILKKITDKACTCSKCRKRAIEFTIWRKYFQLYWIPFMPLGKMEIEAWCIYCNQKFPENIRFKQHLASVKTPWYLYLGLIVTALFFVGMIMKRTDAKNNIETYINAPEIGDVYLVRNPIGQDTIYQFFRLADIDSTGDSISCYYSKKNIYSKKPSTLAVDDYFIADEKIITREYLNRSYKANNIVSVWRNKDIPAPYQKIMSRERTESSYVYIPPEISSETWQTLLSLKFTIYFDEALDDVVFEPHFNEAIKRLDGEIITIKAFMYSEGNLDEFILLSAYRFQYPSCTSPSVESLIKVPKTLEMKLDKCKSCVIRGELEINFDKPLEFPYSLKNIEFMYCEELDEGN